MTTRVFDWNYTVRGLDLGRDCSKSMICTIDEGMIIRAHELRPLSTPEYLKRNREAEAMAKAREIVVRRPGYNVTRAAFRQLQP